MLWALWEQYQSLLVTSYYIEAVTFMETLGQTSPRLKLLLNHRDRFQVFRLWDNHYITCRVESQLPWVISDVFVTNPIQSCPWFSWKYRGLTCATWGQSWYRENDSGEVYSFTQWTLYQHDSSRSLCSRLCTSMTVLGLYTPDFVPAWQFLVLNSRLCTSIIILGLNTLDFEPTLQFLTFTQWTSYQPDSVWLYGGRSNVS